MNLLGITDHRPLVALAPVIGLAAYCVSHVFTARIIRGRSPYPALAIGALVGLAVTIAVTLAACRRDAVSLADTLALVGVNTLAALAFAFGYFNFVNLTVASLRIRILEELAEAGGDFPGRPCSTGMARRAWPTSGSRGWSVAATSWSGTGGCTRGVCNSSSWHASSTACAG